MKDCSFIKRQLAVEFVLEPVHHSPPQDGHEDELLLEQTQVKIGLGLSIRTTPNKSLALGHAKVDQRNQVEVGHSHQNPSLKLKQMNSE